MRKEQNFDHRFCRLHIILCDHIILRAITFPISFRYQGMELDLCCRSSNWPALFIAPAKKRVS